MGREAKNARLESQLNPSATETNEETIVETTEETVVETPKKSKSKKA